jgi:hypothetical protein
VNPLFLVLTFACVSLPLNIEYNILQGYDSLTEQSSSAPISRENARSGHNMISNPVGTLTATNSGNALAAQPASWSHNPYFNPSTGGLELAGVQSPGLQSPVSHSRTHAAARQQQQQQLAAPGIQAMQGGLPQQWNTAAPRQQQQHQRTFSPLGGGATESGVVSPDHVGLELPAAAAAVANGNSWGSGSKQQQQPEFSLTSPRGVAHTQQQQQQQRSLPTELAGGFGGGGVSAQTEYHDAKSRQSEGSWASGREEPE